MIINIFLANLEKKLSGYKFFTENTVLTNVLMRMKKYVHFLSF